MAGSGSKKKAHQENESNQARRRRRREPGQDRDGVRKHILTSLCNILPLCTFYKTLDELYIKN